MRDLVESLVRDVGLDGHRDLLSAAHQGADRSTAWSSARSSSLVPTGSSDFHGPTHKTFSRFGAYDTYGLGEPQVPPKPRSLG